MKLRILDNSVRLRLLRSEVDEFARQGEVRAETRFSPTSVLRYSLEAGDVVEPQVSFENSSVRVVVPAALAKAWTSGGEVAIEGESGGISILIERDFQRTHVKTPLDHDLHPNPRKKLAG
jgi:hypothetical protein